MRAQINDIEKLGENKNEKASQRNEKNYWKHMHLTYMCSVQIVENVWIWQRLYIQNVQRTSRNK